MRTKRNLCETYIKFEWKEEKLVFNAILPNRKLLKKLCEKHKNYKRHRKIIAQKGHGFILPVLSAIIPLITSLLTQ